MLNNGVITARFIYNGLCPKNQLIICSTHSCKLKPFNFKASVVLTLLLLSLWSGSGKPNQIIFIFLMYLQMFWRKYKLSINTFNLHASNWPIVETHYLPCPRKGLRFSVLKNKNCIHDLYTEVKISQVHQISDVTNGNGSRIGLKN